jgi:hypothetical protein
MCLPAQQSRCDAGRKHHPQMRMEQRVPATRPRTRRWKRRSCSASLLTQLRDVSARIREEIDCSLRCGRRHEHLAVERIKRPARAVKTETAFPLLANNDAGYFVLWAVNRISFGHESSIAEACRRPLAVGLSLAMKRRWLPRATRRNNNKGDEMVSRRARRLLVSWVSLRLMESTKTLRGT